MIWKMRRDEQQVGGHSGWQIFRDRWGPHALNLADFWEWATLDIGSNAVRTAFAEFLVRAALDPERATLTEPGRNSDITTRSGLSIEVESATLIRDWPAERQAHVTFAIAPQWVWDAATRKPADRLTRPADLYVFALLKQSERSRATPTDLDNWSFFVVSARAIDAVERAQPLLTLRALETRGCSPDPMWRGPLPFRSLRLEIESMAVSIRHPSV